METYPEYQNDDDIPVWTPDNPSLNKQKQLSLKNKGKSKERVEEKKGRSEGKAGKVGKEKKGKGLKRRIVEEVVQDVVGYDEEGEDYDDDLNMEV